MQIAQIINILFVNKLVQFTASLTNVLLFKSGFNPKLN